LAVRRHSDGEEIDYPDAHLVLGEGDRLLLVGEATELVAFTELAKGAATVPGDNACCQWMQVPDDSPVLDKTLAELHIRRQFGVLIQAIRREGKFIRFPDGKSDLQAGDRLLLCGNFHALNQARLFIAPNDTKETALLQIPFAAAVDPVRELMPMEGNREAGN
jgi:monovalent cation:H+ antiporter-2, CPA2 family